MKKRIVQASKYLGLAAGLICLNSVAMAPAMAATITYNFTGEVDQVGNLLSPPVLFNTSSNVSGSMTVNTFDNNTNANRGSYVIESFTVTVGTYTTSFGLSTGNTVIIRNLAGGDQFVTAVNDLSGPTVGSGLAPDFFRMNLSGPNSLFGNANLPDAAALPASINAFDTQHTWRLVFGSGGNRRTVSGDVSSLTAVPLPTSVILFGLGLVALIGLGAGGLRNIRVPQI
ncbi:MAG: hypothetical protein HOO98_12570 [Nitrospira sp.]|nr:hypothetical protein [Nitrospira sp.]